MPTSRCSATGANLERFGRQTYKWNIREAKRFGLIRNDINFDSWVDDRFLKQALKEQGLESFWKPVDQSGVWGRRSIAPRTRHGPARALRAALSRLVAGRHAAAGCQDPEAVPYAEGCLVRRSRSPTIGLWLSFAS